jgi:hypothetical protein
MLEQLPEHLVWPIVDDWPGCSQVNPKFPLTRPHALVAGMDDFNQPDGFDIAAWQPRPLGALGIFYERCDLVDELRAEFAADPPGQPALARASFGQDDGKLRGKVDIFGDHLDAAVRYVRDRTVARQRAGPELNPREASAEATLAFAPVRCR